MDVQQLFWKNDFIQALTSLCNVFIFESKISITKLKSQQLFRQCSVFLSEKKKKCLISIIAICIISNYWVTFVKEI